MLFLVNWDNPIIPYDPKQVVIRPPAHAANAFSSIIRQHDIILMETGITVGLFVPCCLACLISEIEKENPSKEGPQVPGVMIHEGFWPAF